MRPTLDLSALKGQRARIEIVDAEPGSWGQHRRRPDRLHRPRRPGHRRRRGAASWAPCGGGRRGGAEARPEDPARLSELMTNDDLRKSPTPATNVGGPRPPSRAGHAGERRRRISRRRRSRTRRRGRRRPSSRTSTARPMATGPPPATRSATGPRGAGDVDVAAADSSRPASPPCRPQWGGGAKISRGVLRSPSFVIEKKHVLYRLAGRDAQVRLVVDGYAMDEFNPLLFEGLRFDVKTGGHFRWHQQVATRYLGHHAHIEIVDDGDGWAAIDDPLLRRRPPRAPNVRWRHDRRATKARPARRNRWRRIRNVVAQAIEPREDRHGRRDGRAATRRRAASRSARRRRPRGPGARGTDGDQRLAGLLEPQRAFAADGDGVDRPRLHPRQPEEPRRPRPAPVPRRDRRRRSRSPAAADSIPGASRGRSDEPADEPRDGQPRGTTSSDIPRGGWSTTSA